MGRIFCLMGKSASGKDTIYQHLLADASLRLTPVIPYTTRPIRTGEIDGETYHFCSDAEADRLADEGKVIEMRTYHTVHGDWRYFTADDGQLDPGRGDLLVIATLEAYKSLQQYCGRERVCGIYIWTDDGLRLQRALDRERAQDEPKYAELCRRFLADEQDFSEEKLGQCTGIRCFENRDLSEVLTRIADAVKHGGGFAE